MCFIKSLFMRVCCVLNLLSLFLSSLLALSLSLQLSPLSAYTFDTRDRIWMLIAILGADCQLDRHMVASLQDNASGC